MDEYGDIYCSVEKWLSLADKLTPRQRTRFSCTNLDVMLRIPSVLMRKNLLQFMITAYDVHTKRFVLGPKGGDITVRHEDVYHIFGLRNEGDNIMPLIASVDLDAKKIVPRRFIEKRTEMILIDDLIKNILDSQTYDDDFVRRAVLVLVGTVIAPQSTKFVPYRYYKLVDNIDAIKTFNWNAFTLQVCMDAIGKTVLDLEKFKWPIGNLALFQYIYWEKVQPNDMDSFDALSRVYPLMLNWGEDVAKKRDEYDNIHGRGTGIIDNRISEEYRRAKIAREGTIPEVEVKAPKRKGRGRPRKSSSSAVSSSANNNVDRLVTYIKLLHKEVLLIPSRCAEIVIEKLNTEGVMYKPFKRGSSEDFDAADEHVGSDNGKYKAKEFQEVESSGTSHPKTEKKKDSSFTCELYGTSVPVDDTGAPATTPGKGEPNDPFIVLENGKSPSPASSVPTKEFPSISRTPQNVDVSNESRGGLSPSKSGETYDSFRTICNKAKASGSKGNLGKRKAKPSQYCVSPYVQDASKKCVKKSLFSSPHSILASTKNMNPDHIEAARVFIEKLASSKKHLADTVVQVPEPDGDICTVEMLHQVLHYKWLNGAVINSYCKHLQTRGFRDRHIATTWLPHHLINRAAGKQKSAKNTDVEMLTRKTKVLNRCMDEYFGREKVYFPVHVNNNHYITVVMHTVKEEFQVLNSGGKISQRVRKMIETLRAQIGIDLQQANKYLQVKRYPDVTSWPIKEYDMPLQMDTVSCGLFVMRCIKNWDGDGWTFEFDQQEINEARPRIVAELLFSEANTMDKVKMKIVKIMERD